MSFTEDELQAFNTILEQRLQAHRSEMEHSIDQKLARQMQSIEELLNQHLQQLARASQDEAALDIRPNGHQPLEAIEVQTELPLEDLAGVIGQALDARLSALNNETRRLIDTMEEHLAGRLHSMQSELIQSQPLQSQTAAQDGNDSSVHDLLRGVDHLERVIESLQVVMTANHALLSDRLYSHQQQPPERAHAAGRLHDRLAGEHGSPGLLAGAKGQETEDHESATTTHE